MSQFFVVRRRMGEGAPGKGQRAAPAPLWPCRGARGPVRSENKELFQRLAALGVEIYQQPAGFEDSVITRWKLEKQSQAASCSIGLRDMFAGALSDSALNASAALGQLPVFIRGKMTAAVQVTDTDVAFRLKAKVRRMQQALRTQPLALAEAEGTRAIFKCGCHEVFRTLAEAVEGAPAGLSGGRGAQAGLRQECLDCRQTEAHLRPLREGQRGEVVSGQQA